MTYAEVIKHLNEIMQETTDLQRRDALTEAMEIINMYSHRQFNIATEHANRWLDPDYKPDASDFI